MSRLLHCVEDAWLRPGLRQVGDPSLGVSVTLGAKPQKRVAHLVQQLVRPRQIVEHVFVDRPQKIGDALTWMGLSNDANSPWSPTNWKYLIFGLTLILMMRFRPEGLLPSRQRQAELRDRGAEAEEDAAGAAHGPA